MNSIIYGSPDGKIPSLLMGQLMSADPRNSSRIHGPPDIGLDIFSKRVVGSPCGVKDICKHLQPFCKGHKKIGVIYTTL
jgi:hypothetical protein